MALDLFSLAAKFVLGSGGGSSGLLEAIHGVVEQEMYRNPRVTTGRSPQVPVGGQRGHPVSLFPGSGAGVPFVATPTVPGQAAPVRAAPFSQRLTPNQGFLPTTQQGGNMPTDLGTIVTDLGSAYINARFGQPAVGFTGPVQTVPAQPAFNLGLPMVDVIPEAPTAGSMRGWVYNPSANCGQGGWQKRKPRRRKRLATKGDLQDLAALKGILGMGKAFEIWIATH